MKTNEVRYQWTEVELPVCQFIVFAFRGPGVKKIRDRFTFLILENHINQPSVVFGVGEAGFDRLGMKIKVTETNLQTDKEEALPIWNTFVFLIYHRAPFIHNLCQAPWTVFEFDQVT